MTAWWTPQRRVLDNGVKQTAVCPQIVAATLLINQLQCDLASMGSALARCSSGSSKGEVCRVGEMSIHTPVSEDGSLPRWTLAFLPTRAVNNENR